MSEMFFTDLFKTFRRTQEDIDRINAQRELAIKQNRPVRYIRGVPVEQRIRELEKAYRVEVKKFMASIAVPVLKYVAESGSYNDYTGSMRHSFQAVLYSTKGETVDVAYLKKGDLRGTTLKRPLVVKKKISRTIINKTGRRQKTSIKAPSGRRIAFIQTPLKHGVYRRRGKYYFTRNFKKQHSGVTLDTVDKITRTVKHGETGRPYKRKGWLKQYGSDRISSTLVIINSNPYSRYLEDPSLRYKLYGRGVESFIRNEIEKEFISGNGEFKAVGHFKSGNMKGHTYRDAIIGLSEEAITDILTSPFNRKRRRL